jgi:hypothetical protein
MPRWAILRRACLEIEKVSPSITGQVYPATDVKKGMKARRGNVEKSKSRNVKK